MDLDRYFEGDDILDREIDVAFERWIRSLHSGRQRITVEPMTRAQAVARIKSYRKHKAEEEEQKVMEMLLTGVIKKMKKRRKK